MTTQTMEEVEAEHIPRKVYYCFSGPIYKPQKGYERMLLEARAFGSVKMADGRHNVVEVFETEGGIQLELESQVLDEGGGQ